MQPGSVIVDLAAEQGGNCELTQPGRTIERHGVAVIGAVNLPASVPVHASQLYAHNVVNLFLHLYRAGRESPDPLDEIGEAVCVTRGGEIVNAQLAALVAAGDATGVGGTTGTTGTAGTAATPSATSAVGTRRARGARGIQDRERMETHDDHVVD
jgi:alanine dehydrogenase/PNT-like protein